MKHAVNDADRRLSEIYGEFLPKKILDAHMHLYLGESIPKVRGTGVFQLEKALPEDYMEDMLPLLPGVESLRLNMMPFPDPALNAVSNGLRDLANDHIARQIALDGSHFGAAYVLPGDSWEDIWKMVSVPGICCIKPYFYGAPGNRGGAAAIGEFLPESAWKVANEKGTPIVLHMMRKNLADEDNFGYIQQMTAKYPQAPLVLAHCARGFDSWTAVKYIPKLAERDNIWFDLAAVCETAPMMASILKTAGKRVMWGSDWPICMNRGKAISLKDDQQWLLGDEQSDYARVAAESIFAFYQTALLMDLDQTQVEDIFYHNALALFK